MRALGVEWVLHADADEYALPASPSTSRISSMFERHGIAANRLRLVSLTNGPFEHLNMYNEVDIALDTFPYANTTTTCETLLMGVPVVTLAGKTHGSRVGVTLLHQVGQIGRASCRERV